MCYKCAATDEQVGQKLARNRLVEKFGYRPRSDNDWGTLEYVGIAGGEGNRELIIGFRQADGSYSGTSVSNWEELLDCVAAADDMLSAPEWLAMMAIGDCKRLLAAIGRFIHRSVAIGLLAVRRGLADCFQSLKW